MQDVVNDLVEVNFLAREENYTPSEGRASAEVCHETSLILFSSFPFFLNREKEHTKFTNA